MNSSSNQNTNSMGASMRAVRSGAHAEFMVIDGQLVRLVIGTPVSAK